MSDIHSQRTPAEFLELALDARGPARGPRAKLSVDEFSIDVPVDVVDATGYASALIWRNNSEAAEMAGHAPGRDYGRLLVRIGVDGEFDTVEADLSGGSDAIESLDRAIANMQQVRDMLLELGHDRSGVCLATGYAGRCVLRTGHEAPHKFPVLAEEFAIMMAEASTV